MMFGDLLVSSSTAVGNLALPTSGGIQPVSVAQSELVPAGIAQKMAIISDNLVVGWSGTQYVARGIMRRLHDQFGVSSPTPEELERFFNEIPLDERREVEFIAMLLVNPTTGFQVGFQALELNHARFGQIRACGSGYGDLGDLVERIGVFTEHDGRDLTPYAKAVGCGLTMAGDLLAREMLLGDTLGHHFGGGYEIVTLSDGRWVKVDDILTIFWVLRETHTGGLELSPITHLIKQAYAGDLLVIRSLAFYTDRPAEDRTFYVDPPYRVSYDHERNAIQRPDFQAKWICHQFIVQRLDGTIAPRSRITYSPAGSISPLQVEWNGRRLNLTTTAGYFSILSEFTQSGSQTLDDSLRESSTSRDAGSQVNP
jgi:hypothetical protein